MKEDAMTSPSGEQPEAVDARPADDDAAALDAFDRILSEDEEEEIEEAPEASDEDEIDPEDEPEEGEAEEEEEDDGEGEPAAVIPAPVSFNADEKAAFAKLPTELQTAIAATEARRNAQVQKATTDAAEAKRTARDEAAGEVAQIQRQYAAELEGYAKAIAPQMPDPRLAQTDPDQYVVQLARYNSAIAQRDQLAQQADATRRQSDAIYQQQRQQAVRAEHKALIDAVPEWADAKTLQEAEQELFTVARELGFGDSLNAALETDGYIPAVELLALREIKSLKDKATKWDEHMSQKMAQVRAAKGKPSVTVRPGTAQPKGSGKARALSQATDRLRKSGSEADAAAAFEAMGF